MNTPVKFEVAKLLKEKGFDEQSRLIYNTEKELSNIHFSVLYSAPTIAEVVMWLYEKNGIWISVHLEKCRGYEGYDFNFEFVNDYETTIIKQEDAYKLLGERVFNSPTEAYEAAIEYTLNNLI